jgi:DNA-binding NarL/FixJ family response regulator
MGSSRTAIIADDHPMMRRAIRSAIEGLGDVRVVAEAANGLEATSLCKKHRPDLLVLDEAMPYGRGVETFAEVRRWSPDTRVIVLTGIVAEGMLRDLAAAGVDGLFTKSGDEAEFVAAIPRVLSGERCFSRSLAGLLDVATAEEAQLTRRELQIVAQIASGFSNARIAENLGISPKTVGNHRTNIMRKLNVHSAAALVAVAAREGLIGPLGGQQVLIPAAQEEVMEPAPVKSGTAAGAPPDAK